ncbi:MAG: hypothetical protein ACK4UP_11030 [Spirosomataceae bacterium]|jgi:hypothetical protein|nr:hypothetical protein [Flectobacillus sp.]
MKLIAKSVVCLFASILLGNPDVLSQNTSSDNSVIPFSKWEFGLNTLPLINKSRDSFGFIVKRNFQRNGEMRAARLKILPSFANSLPYDGGTILQTDYAIDVAIGYEWQKQYDRFTFLYGLEPFFRYKQLTVSNINTYVVSEAKQLNTGLSCFIGGKYYLGSHFSVSAESHLVYNYYRGGLISGSVYYGTGVSSNNIDINPIHAVYLSYQF